MTDLNVTEGEWTVTKYGYEKYSINGENGKEVASVWLGDNAHLMAQVKNMYYKLQRTARAIKDMPLCDSHLYEIANEIDELLNACKPPEE